MFNYVKITKKSEQIFCLFFKLWKFLLKYKKVSNLEARKFYFLKDKAFFQSRFFLFFELGKLLPEI